MAQTITGTARVRRGRGERGVGTLTSAAAECYGAVCALEVVKVWAPGELRMFWFVIGDVAHRRVTLHLQSSASLTYATLASGVGSRAAQVEVCMPGPRTPRQAKAVLDALVRALVACYENS